MYRSIKRIYTNSFDENSNEYNVEILDKAIAKGWITEEEKIQIIEEVAEG